MRSHGLGPTLVAFAWLLAACSSVIGLADSDSADTASARGGIATASADSGATLGTVHVVGCDRFTIGESSGPLVGAYGVEDGRLLEPCFGSAEPTVEQAWSDLVAITPNELFRSVTLVAGYQPNDTETVAFATAINDDTEAFLIAVDIETGEDDRNEMRLTMAHELAHVFTQTSDQLDIAIYADECDSYFNGFGCFQPDAYITEWMDTFWSPQQIASLPDDGEIDEVEGEERCSFSDQFPGSYAASHPEEDFAESFAAYVFDIDLPEAVDPRLEFFDQFEVFVEMRNRARAVGLSDLPNNFERCG